MALTGVRVLDMTRILAGPYAAMVLADMGADVVKLEPPSGDDTRTWGPPFAGPETAPEAAYFLGVNRNKRSIAVDLKKARGAQLARELAATCDVVLENFPAGKADALGVGYEAMRAANPRVIYAALSGYGRRGPYAGRLAYDVMVAGLGGLLSVTGPADGAPCKPGVAITDVTSGLFLHGAVAAALYHRERTGRGQRVDLSLLDAQVAALANLASNFLVARVDGRRWGTAHASIVPYQAFRAADGAYLVAGALNDKQFRALAAALGDPGLADDPRFASNRDRVLHRDALLALLEPRFAVRPRAEWLDALARADVPAAPVNSIAEVFDDPQVQFRQLVAEVDHPTVGPLRMVGPPVEMSDSPTSVRRPPPLLGEHTREILSKDLGLDAAAIQALLDDHVVMAPPCT